MMNRTLWCLGISGFFGSLSSMMILSVLPLVLKYKFGMSYKNIGILEGVSMSSYCLFKMFSGIISDKLRERRIVIFAGGILTAFVKMTFGFMESISFVSFARVADRCAKAIATSPTDALISDISSVNNRGKSYGFVQALTVGGMGTGCLLASMLLYMFPDRYETIFFLAVIPSFISAFAILFSDKDKT